MIHGGRCPPSEPFESPAGDGGLTGMDLKWFCVCDYVLLLHTYPRVYVGFSTKIFGLASKKDMDFCTSEVLTNYQTPRLEIQPMTCLRKPIRSIVAVIPLS